MWLKIENGRHKKDGERPTFGHALDLSRLPSLLLTATLAHAILPVAVAAGRVFVQQLLGFNDNKFYGRGRQQRTQTLRSDPANLR
jgi:hypothetical protein